MIDSHRLFANHSFIKRIRLHFKILVLAAARSPSVYHYTARATQEANIAKTPAVVQDVGITFTTRRLSTMWDRHMLRQTGGMRFVKTALQTSTCIERLSYVRVKSLDACWNTANAEREVSTVILIVDANRAGITSQHLYTISRKYKG